MDKIVIFIVVLAVSGCSIQPDKQINHKALLLSNGVPVVDAIVENSAPNCDGIKEFARLDKSVKRRVYIDLNNEGLVCK